MAVKRWNGTTWDVYAGADTSPGFAATDGRSGRRTWVGANAPTAPVDGDIWIDQDTATNAIPASAFDAKGDLMVGTGPDTYTRQAVGTDGQVLVADSSQADGVLWSHSPSRQGLVSIVPTSVAVGSGSASVASNGAVTFSGASTLTLNTVFSSLYENYRITFSATSTVAGLLQYQYLIGASLAASNYVSQRLYVQNTSVGATLTTSTSLGSIGYWGLQKNYSIIEVQSPFLVDVSKTIATTNYADATYPTFMDNFNSVHTTSASYDSIRFTYGAGLMSGNVRIYGYGNGA